jgi:hypothetical protein
MSAAIADFDVADFEPKNSSKGCYVRFYNHAVIDKKASDAEGRPIFVDEEWIEIIAPGNQNNIVRRGVRQTDTHTYSDQYRRFKAGLEEQVVGTPLTEVPWITRSQVEELHYKKVRTLEQLAELSDTACAASAGLYSMKQKAQAWVKKAQEAAPFTAMQAEIEEMRKKLAALEGGKKSKKPDDETVV